VANLSAHFTLEEMTASQEAARRGIDNTPSEEITANLRTMCEKLEAVRVFLGSAMIVSSGYRSPELNKAIGGAVDSAHITGFAVDFICPSFGTPLEVCQAIEKSDLHYDQLIHEYARWTHLSFHPRQRRQALTIFKSSQGYLAGLIDSATNVG
jgi:zinc D-Ala-D-Ala carboxypeptidase